MTDPDPKAVKQAISELRDTSKERRRTAVMKLGMLGGEEALRTLMMVLQNRSEDIIVRGRAAMMLGKLGDERAVDTLIDALDSGGFQTRLNATEALGKIGGTRAVKALLRMLDEDHDKVGLAAHDALENLGYFENHEDPTQPKRDKPAAHADVAQPENNAAQPNIIPINNDKPADTTPPSNSDMQPAPENARK